MTTPALPLVPYETDARPQLRTGDLLFCSGTAPFSRLIQMATGSPWSHVAVIVRLEPPLDRVMVAESVESIGCRFVPLSLYMRNYDGHNHGYPGEVAIARHRQMASVSDFLPLTRFALDSMGLRYDTQEIARIAARIVAQGLGAAPQAWQRDRTYICSEFAWECLDAVGLRLPDNPAGFVAPHDIATAPGVDFLFRLEVET